MATMYFVGLYTYKNAEIYGEKQPEGILGRRHGNYGTDGSYQVCVECLIVDKDGRKARDIDNWLPASIFLGKKEGDQITVPILVFPESDEEFDLDGYEKKTEEEKREMNQKENESRKVQMITLQLFQKNPKYGGITTFEEELQRALAWRYDVDENRMDGLSKETQMIVWREFDQLCRAQSLGDKC